jgi:protein translocase SecG subunit
MVLMQDSKKGMSQALTGGGGDSFYQKNSGRSKEAQLAKATRTAAILFFIVTLVVNVFAIYFRDTTEDIPGEAEPPPLGIDIENFDPDTFDWDSLFTEEFGEFDDFGDFNDDDGGYAAYGEDGGGDNHEPDSDPDPES